MFEEREDWKKSINLPLRVIRALKRRFYFSLRSWSPRGFIPTYRAYYPDRILATPCLRNLYNRWTRGNKFNNNGDAPRFIALLLNLKQLEYENIQGDFAELGVWKGNSAAILADFAAKSDKRVFLLDTFSGFDKRDLVGKDETLAVKFADTSLEYVKQTVGNPEITTYIRGRFPDSITEELRERTFSLVHLDCDLYEPMSAALKFFYPRMSRGSMLIMHDYCSPHWPGATQAIQEFSKESGEYLSLLPDKSGTAVIRKSR